MAVTIVDMPDDEPVDYDTLVSRYVDEHKHLMQSAYSVMTRAIRLGGRK